MPKTNKQIARAEHDRRVESQLRPRLRPQGTTLTADETERLEQLLGQQAVTGLTDEAIAEIIGTTRQTVSRHRRKMAQRLLAEKEPPAVPDAPKPTAKQVLAGQLPPNTDLADEFVGSGEETLTPEGSLRLLSLLARTSLNPNAQVAAVRAVEALRAQIEAPARTGPPDPLTDEDRINRLAIILEAVGPELARKAVDRVWPTAS